MSRTPVPVSSPVPSRLGRLSPTERQLWRAFPRGELVDLRSGDTELDSPANADQWPAERAVRAEVIAALLLGACHGAAGAVAAVRIAGARITGSLLFDHGQVSPLLQLQGCRFDGPIGFDDAITQSIDLSGSQLTTLSAYGAQVRGTLDLRDTLVTGSGERGVHADGIRIDGSLFANRAVVIGSLCLINAQIAGQVTLIDAQLLNRTRGHASLNAGGMRVGRSLLAQRLRTLGELRLPGAHIGSSLLLTGARLNGFGGYALFGDALTVASEASFRPHWSANDERPRYEVRLRTEPAGPSAPPKRLVRPLKGIGTVRLKGARFGSGLDLNGAEITPSATQPALRADRMVIEGTLHLGDGFHTRGEIQLVGTRITGNLDLRGLASPDAVLTLYGATAVSGVHDDGACWPSRLRLNGFTYGPFSVYVEPKKRLELIGRQIGKADGGIGAFRAQPYEQLAAYYRSLGNDGDARTVLLGKQRALRSKLPRAQRIPGYLLDLLVGYGYRPLRAIGWAIGLLAASSAYFSQVKPSHISNEDSSVFNPVLYAADHLIPVIRFGQVDVWQYHGVPAVVASVLTVLGWTLGIAIAAAATRTFNRN